jgi:superfamily II DNA or RNA helicase
VQVSSATTPSSARPFIARLHLFVERFLAEGGAENAERDCPVMSLTFDYGGTVLRSNDERERFFVSTTAGVTQVQRDRSAEVRAQCLVESFGAVELSQVDQLLAPLDTPADYFVQLTDNVHSLCTFTAFVVPQLQALGFCVTIDPEYPYQVVADDPPWSINLEPDQESIDWFALELGIFADGKRVDVLPALLDLIEGQAKGQKLEDLLRASSSRRAIGVAPNRYVTVPSERFRAVLQVILELYRGDRIRDGRLRVGRTQAASLARLDELVNPGEPSGSGEQGTKPSLVDRGRRLLEPVQPGTSANTPSLTVTLRQYQVEGLAWMERLAECGLAGVLADDMGLGKTLQTIALLARAKERGENDMPSLVVCPTSLVGNWHREIERFCPALSRVVYHGERRAESWHAAAAADVVITTYPVLVRDWEKLSALSFHYVVLDEAQAVKNARSQSAQAVATLTARQRLCLSGTPVENNLDELWSLFHFLMPELLGPRPMFQRHFRVPIERHGDAARLSALRELVGPFVLRRMKEEVAKELPPKTELVRPVELEGAQRDLYESIRLGAHSQVRKAISSKGIEGSTITILDALTKLRQVCCDPKLVRLPAAAEVQHSAKRELLFELLTAQVSEGRHVLVFSQFAKMLALISEGLLERGIRHTTLTGQTVDRQRRVDAFQNGDVDVFLISLKAGGTGLNLTAADTVIHYDPWWNVAAQHQATDRAYRIGQRRPVFVHNLIVAGSVEERMLSLQRRKRWLSDSLFGSEDATQRPPMELAEVERLFAPLDEH